MLNKYLVLCSLAVGGVASMTTPHALEQTPNLFGEEYQPVVPVVRQLTQVVYYRTKNPDARHAAANVYVDGRYHTSLLPGGFTRFCLKPGEHTLGAFVNDPLYRGKTEGRFAADLEGGRTYFLRVDENQAINQPPTAVTAQHGENEMKQTHRQIHTRSRAVSVQSCVYDRAAAQSPSSYFFSVNQLFKQERGNNVLSDDGLEAINDMVITLRQQHPLLHSVVIRFSLSERQDIQRERAKAIRNALMLAAIPDTLIVNEFSACTEACTGNNQDIQILVR